MPIASPGGYLLKWATLQMSIACEGEVQRGKEEEEEEEEDIKKMKTEMKTKRKAVKRLSGETMSW
ncbi:hypothetical protein E2C01_068706 [Portunus trituberculatus]|uniref:Uncharacterized protein n=1 Tax=Portunus trituberculatus TaxID=210409 RepID=A0A5B7I075_PORTR|nr:hypothetical protein [Portunus trituberculatus]